MVSGLRSGAPMMQPQPKPVSRAVEKTTRLRAKERHWQALRRQVLQRDCYRCRVCGSGEQVDVHHIRFRSRGGADISSNLAVLCRVHHAELHAYRLAIVGDADGKLKVLR